MRIMLFEHVQNAYFSLKTTKTRTLLTTLGIAIGVASITTVLSLSSGVSNVVANQIQALDGNIAVIRPGGHNNIAAPLTNPNASQGYATSTLTEKDLEDIATIEGVEAAAPLMIVGGSVKAKGDAAKISTIVGTTPALANIAGLSIRDGQFIDSVTNRDTAVIGSQLSVDVFGTDQSIGQTFTIRGQTFTVIGILKPLNNPVNFNAVDFDHAAIISLESSKNFHQGVAQIQQINVRAKDAATLPAAMQAINAQLQKNHMGENDFTTLSGTEIATPTSNLFLMFAGVMTAIATISLVVGGIGIMNIMLVGVAERTREIGLRKAVGASNGNIVWQFLTESLAISLLGGILGYIGGYALAFIISTFLTFLPALSWQIALIALGLSIGTGVLFGIYPALRAARKDPIESLRRYH